MKHVEVHRLRPRGSEQTNRKRDQSKTQVSLPDGTWHIEKKHAQVWCHHRAAAYVGSENSDMGSELAGVYDEIVELLTDLGVPDRSFDQGDIVAHSPITGEVTGRLRSTSRHEADASIQAAHAAFLKWRDVP